MFAGNSELIASSLPTSNTASVVFSNIPQTYKDLLLVVAGRSTSANSIIQIQMNTLSSASHAGYLAESGSSNDAKAAEPGLFWASNNNVASFQQTQAIMRAHFIHYTGAQRKTALIQTSDGNRLGWAWNYAIPTGGLDPITTLTLSLYSGTQPTFAANLCAFYLYGVK